MKIRIYGFAIGLCVVSWGAHAANPPLIIVKDLGGTSALSYYDALNPQPDARATSKNQPKLSVTIPMGTKSPDFYFLPVRSSLLSPGELTNRTVALPGLRPFFIVGDDPQSRSWLMQRGEQLRELRAVGLVVNVTSEQGLVTLRKLTPALTLVPTPADDFAQRLQLKHYPVLITSTRIEQ